MMVVVAGDDHDLADGLAELAQHWPRLGQRRRQPTVTQLDQVPQQHQSIAPRDGLAQAVERLAAPQDVAPGPRGQVQVRDDEGAQRYAEAAAIAPRIAFGSMKRTSSRTTSSSCTSAVPRARKKSISRWTSSSGALAPEVIPTTRLSSSHPSSTWPAWSIRYESAPYSRATSTSRFELEELREPITSTRSHSAASCLTAA